jgi:hypothetical protein
MSDLTYCTICYQNFEDEQFNYLFDYPVCLECADEDEVALLMMEEV